MADNVQQELRTEVEAGSEAYTDARALGFDATMLVGLAMAIVVAVLLWKKVPAAIGKGISVAVASPDVTPAQKAEAEAPF